MGARSSASSRTSAHGAGWSSAGDLRNVENSPESWQPGSWKHRLLERDRAKWEHFSWLTVRALFESLNDSLGKAKPELVLDRRYRWIAGQRAAGVEQLPGFAPGFTVDRSDDDAPAFFLIGDTGEQDASQYAVVEYLVQPRQHDPEGHLRPTSFMVVVSDVIYPAGDINEYLNGLYLPYRQYPGPIFALPGNHDWYDGLNGFMYHFCGAEPLPVERFRGSSLSPGTRALAWLWRGSSAPERNRLSGWRRDRRLRAAAERVEPQRELRRPVAVQPAPYFAIDTADLLLVAIDTGISGELDDEQGRWLVDVSSRKKQKILLTGKPIYVDAAYHPCRINWSSPKTGPTGAAGVPLLTVDDIVREEAFGYIAAIGGDVHNYQHYPVRLTTQSRTIHYVVSGGGGAYLSLTHRIPPVGERPLCSQELPWPEGLQMPSERRSGAAPPEREFRCYPLRGDSLAYSALRTGPRLFTAVLAAVVAFVVAAYLYTDAIPIRASAQLGALALYVLPAALLLGVLLYDTVRYLRRPESTHPARRETPEAADKTAAGKLAELGKSITQSATPAAPSDRDRDRPTRRGSTRGLVVGLVALVALCASTYVIALLSDQDLISSPAFWIAFGLSGLAPVLIAAAVVAAHDFRGSLPSAVVDLIPGLAVVTAVWLWLEPPRFEEAPAWFVVLALCGFSLAPLTLAVRQLRRNAAARPNSAWLSTRLVNLAPPALLAVALADQFDAAWVPRFALAICGGFLLVLLLAPPGAMSPSTLSPRRQRLAALLGFLTVVAWALGALVLAAEVGDGWVTNGLIAGLAILTMSAVTVILLGLAGTAAPVRALAAALAFGAIIVVALLDVPVYWLALLGLASVTGATFLNGSLRVGALNADRAERFVARALDIEPGRPVPDHGPQGHGERDLLNLLYPYARQGWRGGVSGKVARALAELSDNDEPPFFKSFLRADVVSQDGEDDRVLTLRCFGVTGYRSEESQPPEEDRIVIPFRSVDQWKSGSRHSTI